MKNELTATNFDYSVVDTDAKGKLLWFAGEICKAAQSHAQAGLEMGRMLADARELFPTKKEFEAWVAAECRCSTRTAYNYISAHASFGSCATVAQIELGAMYALTKSEKAKKAALKLTEKGVTVTQAMATKLVKEAKPKKPPAVDSEAGGTDEPEITPEEPEAPETVAEEPEPPKNGTPPKLKSRSQWYKMWDQGIGPLVRTVDKIADGVCENHDPYHEEVHKHLDAATAAMMKWMKQK